MRLLRSPRAYVLAAAAGVIVANIAGVALSAAASAAPVLPSGPLSSVTKTGTDATTGATATAGTPGTAAPGDTLSWVVDYTNNFTTPSAANLTDVLQPGQTYVAGSLSVPGGTSAQYSTNGGTTWTVNTPPAGANGVGSSGTVPAGPTATSGLSTPSNVTFTTTGGDGWSVEGFGNQVYTYFHHVNPTVFCQTLTNLNCAGFAGASSRVLSTSYVTSFNAGSFIVGGKLYTPVEATTALPNGQFPVGLYCFNVTTATDCGFAQIDTQVLNAGMQGGSAAMAADGIAASDGNYYVIDGNGTLTCFNGAVCGQFNAMFGNNTISNADTMTLTTVGNFIFSSMTNTLGHTISGCFDVTTHTMCSGYPIDSGVTAPNFLSGLVNEGYPLLDASGAAFGYCVKFATTAPASISCYTTAGAAVPNPFPLTIGGYDNGSGVTGQGVTIGNKYYSWNSTGSGGQVICEQFTGPGTVSPCAGFVGPTATPNGYTVRQMASLPGCLVTDSDSGAISIFSATTGGVCQVSTSSVTLSAPTYCDGKTHSTTWGTLSMPGLTGTEYGAGTYTVYDKNGVALPGFTNVAFTGALNASLAAIPTTGNTAQITVSVNLSGVSNAAAVGASSIQVTRTGDTYSQMCYQTTVNPLPAGVTGTTITNAATAVTTNSGITDGPAGVSSGNVSFNVGTLPGTPLVNPGVAVAVLALLLGYAGVWSVRRRRLNTAPGSVA